MLASKCVHLFVRAVSQLAYQQTSTHKCVCVRALSLSLARARALLSLARALFLAQDTVARVCVGVQRNASLLPPLDFAEHSMLRVTKDIRDICS